MRTRRPSAKFNRPALRHTVPLRAHSMLAALRQLAVACGRQFKLARSYDVVADQLDKRIARNIVKVVVGWGMPSDRYLALISRLVDRDARFRSGKILESTADRFLFLPGSKISRSVGIPQEDSA